MANEHCVDNSNSVVNETNAFYSEFLRSLQLLMKSITFHSYCSRRLTLKTGFHEKTAINRKSLFIEHELPSLNRIILFNLTDKISIKFLT